MGYFPDVETPRPDEGEAIGGIIAAMTQQSEIVAGREHHAVCASPARGTGAVVGDRVVSPGLSPGLAQALFVRPGTYTVAARFAPRTPGSQPSVPPSALAPS